MRIPLKATWRIVACLRIGLKQNFSTTAVLSDITLRGKNEAVFVQQECYTGAVHELTLAGTAMPRERRIEGIQRYNIETHRTVIMRVVPFTAPVHARDHTVRVLDLSVIGAGIESNELMERGLACFEEGLGGHKLGVVKWCSSTGEKYRAGVLFITLPFDEEQYVLNRIRLRSCRETVSDPATIFDRLLATLQQDRVD